MKERDFFSDPKNFVGQKTIGYFGDSFCASNTKFSWCQVLAKNINRWPVHWGKEGSSIWHIFLEIEKMKEQDTLPDTLVICYTEPYRIYHPDLSLTPGTNSADNKEIHNAADLYRVYLQNNLKDNLAYRYSIQWFDQHILHDLQDKHHIIQMWSMNPKDIMNPQTPIDLTTGLVFEQSILDYAYRIIEAGPGFNFPPEWQNHMSDENNIKFAKHIFPRVSEYLKT
tara:strand:- start:1855 stop:2529 length:675 start_codon:yes stop_codon:yes gene_type:complete